MLDYYNIASGHIYNMQFDLHQNPDWFVRCEQHKVAEIGDFDPTIGLGGGFEWSCTHNSSFELSKVTLMNFPKSFQDAIPGDLILDKPNLDGSITTSTIKVVASYKYFGVIFNPSLHWNLQQTKVTTSAKYWVPEMW